MNKQEFLSFLLPFKLKCQVTDRGNITISELNAVYSDGTCTFHNLVESDKGFSDVKPILRPLSELKTEIEINGTKFTPFIELLRESAFDVDNMSNEELEYFKDSWAMPELFTIIDSLLLAKWNFDFAELIDKGEAIDYSTLKGFVF